MKFSLRLILASVFIFNSSLGRCSNPFGISDDLDKTISAGLYELYNLHFDKALTIFDGIRDQAKEHPMVAFGIASVHWWRLSVCVLETDQNESQAFLKATEDCIRISKEKIERGDPRGEAHLTLGGAEGLLGRWEGANRQWMPACFNGKSP